MTSTNVTPTPAHTNRKTARGKPLIEHPFSEEMMDARNEAVIQTRPRRLQRNVVQAAPVAALLILLTLLIF